MPYRREGPEPPPPGPLLFIEPPPAALRVLGVTKFKSGPKKTYSAWRISSPCFIPVAKLRLVSVSDVPTTSVFHSVKPEVL